MTLQTHWLWRFVYSATRLHTAENRNTPHGYARILRRVNAFRCRSRSHRMSPSSAPPGTSSSAAVKGFQEVTLLLAGSLCPAGGKAHLEQTTHTRSDRQQKKTTRRETYFQQGPRWQIRVMFLQTSCLRRSSRSLSPLHKDDGRASQTVWVTESTTVEHGKLKCQITLAIQLRERAVLLGGRKESAT